MKNIVIVGMTLGALAACATAPQAAAVTKEERAARVTDQQRMEDVQQELNTNPKSIAFFAKGMCCQSCAIGVRVHVATMNFVDTSRFNKGVKLNALTQVVTVAVKDDAKVHPNAIKVAVQRAGYEPVEMYQLVDGKVARQSFQ